MIYSKGLATEEDKKEVDRRRSEWSAGAHGCVDRQICKGCGHLIVDSICLCSGNFTCPNCQLVNSPFGEFLSLILPTKITLDNQQKVS